MFTNGTPSVFMKVLHGTKNISKLKQALEDL